MAFAKCETCQGERLGKVLVLHEQRGECCVGGWLDESI